MSNRGKKSLTNFSVVLVMSILLLFGCSKANDKEQGAESGTSKEDTVTEVSGDNSESATSTETEITNAPSAVNADTTAVEPTIAPTLEPLNVVLPQPDTDYVTDEMLTDAVMAEGNLARLAAVIKKAMNGEEITVGVIGGSITQGSMASNQQNSYASRFYQWWVTAFPDTKVNFVNAGIGATTSYLGVHRVDKDLLSKKPDVVIIEFSVNDSDSLFYKETYEDLVRKILTADNNPAVLLLFMTMEDGTSAQPSHMHIGFWYDLPRISYRQTILKEIEKGTFTWKDISPDNIHPNDKGHAIIGEILWSYLNNVYAKLNTITEEVKPLDKKPFFKEAYMDAIILDSETIVPVQMGSFEKSNVYNQFNNDWTSKSGNDSIIFETEAQNIGIMFYKTIDGKSGQFDVYIDDKFNRTLDANFKGGWGNYAESIEIFRSKDKLMHKIEIKKADDSTGDIFSILGLLIS